MGSGKATPVEKWAKYLLLRRSMSIYQAAKEAGVNYHSARDNESGRVSTRNYVVAKEQTERVGVSTIPCLLYTSPTPRALSTSRMPSSA